MKLIASFNNKMKLGVNGRKATFDILKNQLKDTDKTFWFHCASLGEYEQGLPVFESIKREHPEHRIVLSFFSPSGFEVKKESSMADIVVYLPLDTKSNAKRFIELVKPELVIFVKYEIWPNYLNALRSRGIESLLISALFRGEQIYFKWHGKLMREALSAFDHIFVQDIPSKDLLETIGLTAVTVSGDTRFDRVSDQLNIDNTLVDIDSFKNDKVCLVAGSTWPQDERLLIDYINGSSAKDVKFIIAPHNIKTKQIEELQDRLHLKTIRYSQREGADLAIYDVLIIDSIGLLSKIYSYADLAYVGGGLGTSGLHNILEPATFGVPIVIGHNYANFPEAKSMIDLGGVLSVSDGMELGEHLDKLLHDEQIRTVKGSINQSFIESNTGAVIQIMNFIRR